MSATETIFHIRFAFTAFSGGTHVVYSYVIAPELTDANLARRFNTLGMALEAIDPGCVRTIDVEILSTNRLNLTVCYDSMPEVAQTFENFPESRVMAEALISNPILLLYFCSMLTTFCQIAYTLNNRPGKQLYWKRESPDKFRLNGATPSTIQFDAMRASIYTSETELPTGQWSPGKETSDLRTFLNTFFPILEFLIPEIVSAAPNAAALPRG